MFYTKEYFVILLCFMIFNFNTCTNKIKQNILDKVEINNSNHDYIKQVNIAKYGDIGIYQYSPKSVSSKSIDVLNVFYIAVSCKFTKWTINALYMLIAFCPLTSRLEYENDPWYISNIKMLRQNFVRGQIKDLKKYIARFVTILKHILNIVSEASYYTDTTILQMFLSIKIKIHFISSTMYENPSIKIVQLIIKEMTDIQGFLSTNCSAIPPSKNDSQFSGYFINIDGNYEENHIGNLNDFLFQLNEFGLEINSPQLDSKHMYLENFVTLGLTDRITNDILDTLFSDSEHVKIVDVLTNDIDFIYTLQNSILEAVLKVTMTKFIMVVKYVPPFSQISNKILNKIPQKIANKILNINTKIIKIKNDASKDHSISLPIYFVKGFANLSSFCGQYNENITTNHASLLKKIQDYVEEPGSVNLGNNVQSENTLTEENYLHDILDKVGKELDAFHFYVNSVQIMQEHNDKYNAPLVNDKNLHFLVKSNPKHTACEFVLRIYELCIHALFYYKECCGNNQAPKLSVDNIFYLKRAIKTYSRIKLYMIMLFTGNKMEDLDLLKMTFNVTVLLMNIPKEYEKGTRVFEISCISNVIENELNKYSVTNCVPPKYNLLPFNNVNFMNLGDNHAIRNAMNTFFNHSDIEKASLDTIPPEKYQFLDIHFLYDKFVVGNKNFKSYKEIIMISWKGKATRVLDIFNDIMMYSIDPQVYYAFYKIYFKFYIAIVYYEIAVVRMIGKIDKMVTDFQIIVKLLCNVSFTCDSFPEEFHSIVNDINSYTNYLAKPVNTKHIKSADEYLDRVSNKEIDEQFINFNIFIAFTHGKHLKSKMDRLLFSKFIKNIGDSYENVKLVNSYFGTFKKYS